MRYALRTRQAILVAVGTAYVLVLAWFNRQPIPTTSLIHETNNTLALRTTGTSYLGSHNRDSHWIEPAAYLQPEKSSNDSQIAPGAIDIDAGLLHIRIHSEFSTGRKGQPLGGLLKAYRKSLGFLGKQKTPETQWELLFVKRFPGPVRHAYLDRTRMRRADGSYEPRRLAVLYYTLQNESIEYGVRIYNIDDMVSSETGSRFTDPGPCPDDNRAAADKVYSNPVFKHCIGHSEKVMSHIDIHIPGALDVLEFSLRGDTLVYSRLNDVVRFRMLHVPSGVQTLGPYVIEHMRDVGSQSFLAQLHSTRPGNSVDVFLAHGHIVSDTFYFSFGLMQNSTRSNSWINKDVKRYRLTVHQQFSGLSRDELRLVNDAPLVDQAGLTSVFYFKATDVIVAIDTEWFRDAGSSSITQLQRVRESRPPYISTLNSPVAVNLTLDDSGALLAMTTVDDELFVFSRARASTTKRILDYRRYFSNINLLPWIATEPLSSINDLEEGETDAFNWQLMLTWQPSTLLNVISWEDGFVSSDMPFPAAQRLIARTQQQQEQATSTCLRFLRFNEETTGNRIKGAASDHVIRVAALSASGRLRLWQLDSHEQNPHILWPFVTEHWGLVFMLGAVLACCVYNERRWE